MFGGGFIQGFPHVGRGLVSYPPVLIVGAFVKYFCKRGEGKTVELSLRFGLGIRQTHYVLCKMDNIFTNKLHNRYSIHTHTHTQGKHSTMINGN